jgi:RNA polymerase sigma factor (sigma-70 family)
MPHPPLDAVVLHIRRLTGWLPGPGQASGDAELLRTFLRSRDEAAFAALLDRHGPMVWAVCRRMLPRRCDAEDAFQATFLVLVRKARSIREQGSVGSWLYGVASRIAARMRAQATQRRLLESEAASRASTDRETPLQELCAALHEELSQLPARCQGPLVLCYLEGKTQDEAAQELRLSLRTIKRRLQRGRHLLRQRLTRRGLALSTALLATGLSNPTGAAGLPLALRQLTLRSGLAQAQSQGATAGVVSAQVAALVEGAVVGSAWPGLKITMALVLVLSAAVGAAGLATHHGADSADAQDLAQPKMRTLTDLERSQITPYEWKMAGGGDRAQAPDRLVAVLGDSRLKHFGYVSSVAFSPDGKAVLSAGDDGVRFWDAETGHELRRFVQRPNSDNTSIRFACMALSPDGRMLAAGGIHGAVLWEVSTGRQLRTFHPDDWVHTLAFSPDSRLLATGLQRETQLWDVESNQRLQTLAGHGKEFRARSTNDHVSMAFALDGRTLWVSHPDGSVRKWDTGTGRLLTTIAAHETSIASLALSKDGKYLATGADKLARLWDAGTGRLLHTLPGHQYLVQAVAFHPQGKTLVTGGYRKIKYWNIETGALVNECAAGQRVGVMSLALSPDGRLLASGGAAVDIWDSASGRAHVAVPGGHGAAGALAWTPDGRLLAVGGEDGTIQMWKPTTQTIEETFNLGEGSIQALAISPDGTTLAALDDRTGVYRWNLSTKRQRPLIEAHSQFAGTLAWSPDGRWLAASYMNKSEDYTVKLWDVPNDRLHSQLSTGRGSLVFSADSKSVRFAGQNPYTQEHKPWIDAWEVMSLRAAPRVEKPAGLTDIGAACLSPDGRTLALAGGSYDANNRFTSMVVLWDVAKQQPRLVLDRVAGASQLAFAPDGRSLLALSRDNQARIWDPRDGKLRETIRLTEPGMFRVRHVAFAPDSRHFAAAMGNGVVYLLRIQAPAETVAEKTEPPSSPKAETPAPAPWRALIGKPAPELQQIAGWLAGKPTRLADLRGKHVLLHFWNLESGAAVQALTVLQAMFGDKDLAIVVVHPAYGATAEQLKKHLSEDRLFGWGNREPPFPVALDGGSQTVIPGTGHRLYGATHAAYRMIESRRGMRVPPTTLIIDPAGNVVDELPLTGMALLISPVVSEMQVRLKKEPRLPAVEGRFKELYALKDGEVFRFAPPPYPRERDDYMVYHLGRYALLDTQAFHFDGQLHYQQSGNGMLGGILETLLGLKPYEVEGPVELLQLELKADWVYRKGTPPLVMCRALEEAVRKDFQRPVSISLRQVERPVIVARGRFQPPAGSSVDKEKTVHFYLGAVAPAEGNPGTFASVRELLRDFSDIIRERIINEAIEPGPLKLKWQNHLPSDIAFDRHKMEKIGPALERLSRQTGLEFRIERRKVDIWQVTAAK